MRWLRRASGEAEMAGHLHGAGMTLGKAALGGSGRLGGRCWQLKTLSKQGSKHQGRNTSQKGTGMAQGSSRPAGGPGKFQAREARTW